MNREPKVLLYDIEVTPILGWTYGMFEHNVIKVERPQYIMCFSYKWFGEKTIVNVSQSDFIDYYEKEPYSDRLVAESLWSVLDDADVVVGHYAGRFDNRISTARFMQWEMGPPSPYKTVDTLQVARRYFKFGSNSLNSLCEQLEIGTKSSETHGQLWYDCVRGDPKSWRKLKTYCNNDVKMLEGLYERELPYIQTHPNMAVLSENTIACPKCGSVLHQSRGHAYTNTGVFRRYQCLGCSGWFRERVVEKPVKRPEYVNISG